MSQPVRAYLPGTVATVVALRDRGQLPAGPAYAVTPQLRAELAGADEEELEYEAFSRAARASLDLLRADPSVPRRRVVIAVDSRVVAEPGAGEPGATEPGAGEPGAGEPGARVRLLAPVQLPAVAALHLDAAGAEPMVAAALTAPDGADSDQPDPDDLDQELEWYDVSELGQLP